MNHLYTVMTGPPWISLWIDIAVSRQSWLWTENCMRKIFYFFSKFALLIYCLSANAQQTGQWVEDLFFVFNNSLGTSSIFLVDENNVIKRSIAPVTSITEFPVLQQFRSRSLGAFWHNDGVFMMARGAFEKSEDGKEFRRNIFAAWQEDTDWHYIGYYKTDQDVSFNVIPCDHDRFIGISNDRDLTGNTSRTRSPFYRMSVVPGKEEIRLDASIYHGMDELQEFMLDNTCFELPYFNCRIVMTDNHATIINLKTGLYWVFSLEKAALVKAGKIFSKMTPEMIAKGGFNQAVLHALPEKAGTILVSTQAEAAFMTETNNLDWEMAELNKQRVQPGSTMKLQDMVAALERRRKEIVEQNPYIEWYRIYPENGKVEKLGIPPEGGAIDREGGKNDVWWPMPDGSVKMGSPEFTAEEPKKQEQKAKEVQVTK